MIEKRFEKTVSDTSEDFRIYDHWKEDAYFISCDDEHTVDCLVRLMNKQQETITTLKRRLEKINGGYGHLTHRNGLTANEWVIERQEKELREKDKQISEWIERHSKDIVKIGEQNKQLRRLYDYFQDYLSDEMSADDFSEMWDHVKDDE